MPKVYNKYKDKSIPADAVYIGRPSKWGNPFPIDVNGREAVVEKYDAWLHQNNSLMDEARVELKGKDLVCFCAPKVCHGDILLEVANG